MRISKTFIVLCSVLSVRAKQDALPQPKLTSIKYWGSACPDGGLSTRIGTVDTAKNSTLLSFTLANFIPTMGSFGSSLRMCSIVANIVVDQGWKLVVNREGTHAEGQTDLPANATMFLRTTYSFAERTDIQSVGMFNIQGPLNGEFATNIIPESSEEGALGGCAGGELDIEFQARAVDDFSAQMSRRESNETSWNLTTSLEISPC